MSSVLPFEIISLIIDTVGENKDTDLLKELALVSHSFLQICSKHLFATVELHDAIPNRHVASSKKGFVKLLESRPEVLSYIRKLTYKLSYLIVNDDLLLSRILINFLPTFSRLNCLTLNASYMDWNILDSSLTSALLHLMHLPTINHIDLSYIHNFPLSSLTPSANLHRLDIFVMDIRLEEDGSSEIVMDMMPKIREFHTSESSPLMTKLLHAKRQDGQPAFNFMDLRRLSISSTQVKDEQNIRYLLQNAELLERLHLSIDLQVDRRLKGLLSPTARTLKVLDLTVFLYNSSVPRLADLYGELEAMAGHDMLEALSFEVQVYDDDYTEEANQAIGYMIQEVEKVLVKPGWSALRQVSFKVVIARQVSREDSARLLGVLQSLPDKYLSHLPKIESVAFNYSAYVVEL
jgi:hypothetical protein